MFGGWILWGVKMSYGLPFLPSKIRNPPPKKIYNFYTQGVTWEEKNVINYNDSFTRWGKGKQAAEDFVTVCDCDCGCIHVFLDVYCLHVLVNVYMSFVNFYMSLWMSSSLCGCLHVFLNIFMSLCMSACLCGSLYVFVNVFICLCGCLHVIVNV